ncbi:MAG: hypothetical protein OHK003_29430 [Anaerolineales bacterium]
MRKKFILSSLVLLISACSTSTPEATYTPSPTLTPVNTPVDTETPTPRPSATIVKIPTWDPNQPTFTPFVILIDGKTITPFPTPTSSRPGAGFESVTYSPKKIYWGGCSPNSVIIRAEVEDPDQVFTVLVFTRVKDFEEEDYTPWKGGALMVNRGQGEFTYKLIGSEIYGHDHYLHSWVYFQLVAVTARGEEVGRTRIYEKAFDLYPCPCLTPLTGCPVATRNPKPTPTPSK